MSPLFVISAGRTGTVFLTRTLPAHVPGLHCVHEPAGSRTNLMLGNFRAATGLASAALERRLARGIADRFASTPYGERYVEINPMLCPMADLLPELVEPLNVVHLVRHPAAWVQSIRAFRASGFRRYLIDHLPFGNPGPSPLPPGWLSYDQTHKALWRWRACNEAIEAIEPQCATYTRLRYEDLFAVDIATRTEALLALLAALDVTAPSDLSALLEAPVANRAPQANKVDIPRASLERICGPLMARYAYTASNTP